jgi:nitric-oxide synthase
MPDAGARDADDVLPGAAELLAAAERFIGLFHDENPTAGAFADRMRQVRGEVQAHGTYRHTPAELAFAARVAWRNSSRCIGRLYWRTLRVRDRRQVNDADQIAAECVTHLRQATNAGRIRPMITVFAPDAPGCPGPRVLNSQLIGYAGYQPGTTVIGDPTHLEITRLAHELGWRAGDPPGRFDLLPLIVQSPGLAPAWFELPRDAVLEVPLRHPDLAWFRELRLRWYAVPVISDMYLDAGGIRYPAAPFNGWYMCTEIGSRDLGDEGRYNQLPEIAARMGLRTDSLRTLWKDRAVTELNAAVLHSYGMSGVKIADHHTESERFLAHVETEQRHGRRCPADWSWIVPPTAGSTTPVFHRHYEDFAASPNFYRHDS